MAFHRPGIKSLTELIKGKRGSFRRNLLGKRVDYSGRSVIAPGPNLQINECALPRAMAIELFKPLVYSKLMLHANIETTKEAKALLMNNMDLANVLLVEVASFYPVILNRSPTLHKLSIRALKVKLTNEKVIRLHPLICSGFNADFDGDQMAVHVPLSYEARIEAMNLIMPTHNVLHPANGWACILPTQDMVMGLYYLSLVSACRRPAVLSDCMAVSSVLLNRETHLHDVIKYNMSFNGKQVLTLTTPGRALINELIPVECNIAYSAAMPCLSKSMLNDLIQKVHEVCGKHAMIRLCDSLMKLGFKYAMLSGVSLHSSDLAILECKKPFANGNKPKPTPKLISDIHSEVEAKFYRLIPFGLSICTIVNSGAKGALTQLNHLVGARGVITGLNGRPSGALIMSSYMRGLSIAEFFDSACPARTGLIDTVLKTASNGHLTRKLVEVCREVVITQTDCGTCNGICINLASDEAFMKHRIIGRVLAKPVIVNNKCIVNANELIDNANANAIMLSHINKIFIRSPITCQLPSPGVCCMCYGIDIGTGLMSKVWDSVGLIAAQSIAEPGTQLTLRSFHGAMLSNGIEAIMMRDSNCNVMAPCSGILRVHNLGCVCNGLGNIVIINTSCVLSIWRGSSVP